MAGEIPKNIRASLYIDGKPAEASLKSVEQVTRTLERDLKNLTIGTDAWNKKMQEVAANKKYLKEVKDEINGVGGAFGQLKQELGKVGTLAAGYLGFQFITSQFQGIIAGNAKLSDSLADVRRVTGLTEAAVLNLDSSLGKLDTRTSKSGLREIAIIAGKLGVAKNQILGFVEATDKLVVSLGDELGDADKITTTLGKILNVFDGEVTGDNISRLGNAMVKLANDGVASAGFISDFTQRVSGIAKTAGLSLPATLAFGAGIEELGGRSESAATAMQKLLMSISSDTPKAAKIAGLSLKDFTKLLGDAPEQALLKYTRGLVANKTAFSDVTKSLDDAGEECARTIETITKLGQNTDFFTGKIKDATTAIGGYNEINEAFALKNQTLGAQVDKLGKDFNSLSTNKTLVNFLTNVIILATQTVAWIKKNSDEISKWIKVIAAVTAGWIGYRTAVVLANTVTAISSAFMATARTVSLLYALAQATLTGNTLRAAAAQRLLGLTMAANPFGVVLAVVSALAAAYVLFNEKITTAAKIQEDLNSVKAEAQKKMVDEKNAIAGIISAINNENTTKEQKIKLINQLRGMMPTYLKDYSDEEILAGKAVGAINKYIAALERKSLAQAAQEAISKLQKENIDIETSPDVKNFTWTDEVKAAAMNAIGQDGTKFLAQKSISNDRGKIKENNTRIKEIQGLYGADMYEAAVSDAPTGGGGTVPGKVDKKAESAAAAARKKRLAEEQKLKEELAKISDEIFASQLDKNQKEVSEVREKYNKLRKEAKDNGDLLIDIDNLENKELIVLTKKQHDEELELAKKAGEKIAKERKDAELKILEATSSAKDIEIAQTITKYDELVALAKQFNLDTVALETARQKALDAINNKGKVKTPEQIAEDNKKIIDIAFDAARDVSDAAFEIGRNNRQYESDYKIAALEKERDAELDNKNLTEVQKAKINDKYNAKINEEKTKAWENERKAAITQAIINGALAATNIWATTPKVDFGLSTWIMLGASAASTLASVAVMSSAKPPQFATGGFSNEDPSGYVSSATVFNRSSTGRPFVAGEAGKEWIAPNWMLENPKYANIIGTLEVARKEKRMFASGGYNSENSNNSGSNSNNSGYNFSRLEALMIEMISSQRKANNKKVINVWSETQQFLDDMEADKLQQSA